MIYHNNLNNNLTNKHARKQYGHNYFDPLLFMELHSIHLGALNNNHQPTLLEQKSLMHWLHILHLIYHCSLPQERGMLYMHYFMNQHQYQVNFKLMQVFQSSMKKSFSNTLYFIHFHKLYVQPLSFPLQLLETYQFQQILHSLFIL